MPILDVLQKNGLTDVCCVVTRYFGGVLLGANGLVRRILWHSRDRGGADQDHDAVLSGFDSDRLCTVRKDCISHLPQEDILQLDTIFEDQVELKLLVRDTLWDKLKQID